LKELAHEFLLELYTLRRVINSVNKLYYEGQQALFPQVGQGFEELVGYIERLVELYNRDLAEGLDRLIAILPKGNSQKSIEPFSLDVSTLNQSQGGNYILQRWQRRGSSYHQCVGSGL